MGTPASNGKLCTKIEDMSIGDYIRCEYLIEKEDVVGIFQNLGGESSLEELPSVSKNIAKGYFYFIKVDKGLLVADRIVQDFISWSTLNKSSYIYGGNANIAKEKSAKIRVLSQIEWTKYLTNGTCNGNILAADKKVWNAPYSWRNGGDEPWNTGRYMSEHLQDNINGLGKAAYYLDGKEASPGALWSWHSGHETYYNKEKTRKSEGSVAFRPALEYVENSKSTNIWY